MNFPLFPDTASELARQIDALYFFALGVTAFFSLLIAAAIFYLAAKYRRRRPDAVGQREKAAVWLEVLWSVIPLGILLFMFAWGALLFFDVRTPPRGAVEYYVTGKQWMWKFQHPSGQREINELHVPVGQPTKLIMTSEDTIHSFYVPALRAKMDVLPGRYTTFWFEAEKTGTFRLFCAEYCGAEHSLMGGRIIVMEPSAYEEWLAGSALAAPGEETAEELFARLTCNTCHKPDSAALGPVLHGIWGEEVTMVDGSTAVVDENYVRESILEPGARVVAGYNNVMPTQQGKISEGELATLIQYIKSLGAEGHGDPAASDSVEAEGVAATAPAEEETS